MSTGASAFTNNFITSPDVRYILNVYDIGVSKFALTSCKYRFDLSMTLSFILIYTEADVFEYVDIK